MRYVRNWKKWLVRGSLVAVTLAATCAVAEEAPHARAEIYKPTIIYQYSGEGKDSTFIHAAYNGIIRAEEEFKSPIEVVQVKTVEELPAAIQRAAESGANPVVLLGNLSVEPVSKLAPDYPMTHFTVIDGLVPPIYQNVHSVLFKNNEGAFLVGIIAGKMSHNGFIGFVGGMDGPLIRNFAAGFTQGVKYAAPNAVVNVQMVGNNADAWNNPEKAHTIAISQFHEGAEVVFAAAGGSSIGVLKAADETGKLAIGVDTNQNGLYPGRVLTSMVKRVDAAVYDTLRQAHDGSWTSGLQYLGVKEGALDYAVDQYNRALMTEPLIEQVATARDRIVNGTLTVDSYNEGGK